MTPYRTIKSPREVLDYVLAPEGAGWAGDSIASAVMTYEGGISVVEDAVTPVSYHYTISGGQPGRSGLVRILLISAQGLRHEAEHTVTIVR